MIKITENQIHIWIADEAGFVTWYVERFMPEHLPDEAAVFPPDQLAQMIARGRSYAVSFGFSDPVSQAHFVTLMWKVGSNFFLMPGFHEIASATSRPGPERIDAFFAVEPALGDGAIANASDQYWYPEAARPAGAAS